MESATSETPDPTQEARHVAEKLLADFGETVPDSHLQWLSREVFKLMKRELEVSRREQNLARREPSRRKKVAPVNPPHP